MAVLPQDPYKGQSGGGILNKLDEVIGVHTRGHQLRKEQIDNEGVLLTEEKIERVAEWIEYSWEVRKIAKQNNIIKYTEKNYNNLLQNLENNFTTGKICLLAGYSPGNYNQNFKNMKNTQSEVIKQKRWKFILKNLKKEGKPIQKYLK